jgi:hypothetical protein
LRISAEFPKPSQLRPPLDAAIGQALDFPGKVKDSGDYQFEAVLCGTKAAA